MRTPKSSKKPSPSTPSKPAGHDTAPPEALLELMVTGWKAGSGKPPRAIAHAKAHAARRRALSALFPGEVLVIPTGHEKIRANDTTYRFRPGTEFFYLTGCHEPDVVLVLLPVRGGHRDVLFVEPNHGRTDATFFTDRMKGELWVGSRPGVAESAALYAVDEARALTELPAVLGTASPGKVRVLRGFSGATDALCAARPDEERALAEALSEMRLIKDATEVRELSQAIAATYRGFDDVIASIRQSRGEREVEGVFNLRARVEGNDVGYGTIAACGHHACVLHWTRNDGQARPGDLLLLDAGIEGRNLYTADITRSLPVSGTFSPAQREVYELVWRAHQAAMAAVKPGAEFLAPNRAAMEVLAHGLEAMGILTDADEALRPDRQLYKRYTLHNVSHMLGLDVHDCARARQETYRYGALQAGMVLTIEPGLYFQKDDLTVPAKYRGIGVRIEDDVLVTARGHRNLSAAIPSQVDDVERWIAAVWKKRKPAPMV